MCFVFTVRSPAKIVKPFKTTASFHEIEAEIEYFFSVYRSFLLEVEIEAF